MASNSNWDDDWETSSSSADDTGEPCGDADGPKPVLEPAVRGVPKSGRPWKSTRTARHSAIKRGAGFSSKWAKKQIGKQQLKVTKLLQKEIREAKTAEIQAKKERRKEQEERRKLNERKAEIVQVVKNAHKLKRLKKKLLRTIEKRDTTVVEPMTTS